MNDPIRQHTVGIHTVLSRSAREHGARTAIVDDGRGWSFEQLDELVAAAAGQLDRHGVQHGERVAVQMANRVELPVAVLALARLGAVAVLLSPAWKEREVDHALELTGARRGVVDDDGVVLTGCLGAGMVLAVPFDDHHAGAGEAGRRIDVHDDAVLVFSSGTTGLPKAVRHTHASMLAATDHWVDALGLGVEDRFQVSTPPSHILGLLNLLAALRAGATVRLHRRFDLDAELRAIESDRLTIEMAVAPIVLAIANHPDLERYDLSSLRYVMWGATPVTPSVAARVTERTGVAILAAYGASEVPVLAANPVASPERWRLDSPGLPPADVALRVVDPGTGEVLPAGARGEIQARGPSMMAGYLPAAADAAAFDDGWYRTGDIGTIETSGWVRLTDRAKDMIKVSGFQVAPAELEAVLLGHPAVVDCAVFGVADERTGEAPVAAVQLDPAVSVDDAELADLIGRQLAGYKRLRSIERVASIPRLPSGKALRRELRAQWAGDHARQGEDVV